MNTKSIGVLLLFLVLLAMITTASAQYQIGINQSDQFTYDVDSNSNVPLIYGVVNSPKDVEKLIIVVNDILEPSIVNLNITQQFKDGTQTSYLQDKDLKSAFNFPITFANLDVGDPLWSSESLPPNVNDTVTENSRQINHAFVGPSETGYDLVDYLFDRQTGMPIKISFVESDGISTTLTLTETTVWVIPEFSSILIPLLFMIVLLIVTVLSLRMRNHNSAKKA